MTRTNTGVAV